MPAKSFSPPSTQAKLAGRLSDSGSQARQSVVKTDVFRKVRSLKGISLVARELAAGKRPSCSKREGRWDDGDNHPPAMVLTGTNDWLRTVSPAADQSVLQSSQLLALQVNCWHWQSLSI